MDTEDTARLDESVVKTKARNNVETNILNKKIKQIDKQCRAQVTRIQTAITEERRFHRRLKRQAKKFSEDNDIDQVITKRMDNIKNNGLYSRNSRSRPKTDNGESKNGETETDMFVSGQRFPPENCRQPAMYFWSQDASTKLPVMSSFYGYRLSLQRSMTEVKLLGQQVYPENRRETQSADPMMLRNNSSGEVRKGKSGVQRFHLDFDDEMLIPSPKGAPPPTREKSYVSDFPLKTPERSVSAFELKQRLPRLDTPASMKPKTPENMTLNMRLGEEVLDNVLSQRTAGLATRGSLRSPTKKRVLQLKTRSEATKEYQELLSHKTNVQPKVLTDLDRSYSHVPTVMEEVNRLKNSTTLPDRRLRANQYTKSAFCLSMQNAISKKVFAKSALPVAFRKNHNTFLKHYSTPMMEVKASKMLPVPLTVDT